MGGRRTDYIAHIRKIVKDSLSFIGFLHESVFLKKLSNHKGLIIGEAANDGRIIVFERLIRKDGRFRSEKCNFKFCISVKKLRRFNGK